MTKNQIAQLIVCLAGSTAALMAAAGTGESAERFVVTNGTVKDSETALVWQQGFSPSQLTGEEAKAYCGALALGGLTWRLPSVRELHSLVDFGVARPAALIDQTAFPATPAAIFWTATPYVGRTIFAWHIDFSDGTTTINYVSNITNKYQARCVAGPSIWSASSFTDNGDGTVTDVAAATVWEKTSSAACKQSCTQADAATYCAAKGAGWRLPTVPELLRLVDHAVAAPGPTINVNLFPGTSQGVYWTGTPYRSTDGTYRYVTFYGGGTFAQNGTDRGSVRCTKK